MNSFRIFLFVFLVFSFSTQGCKDDAVGEVEITYDSPDGTPESQGMDPKVLAEAYQSFQKYEGVYSLLVMRNGKIIAEQYFNGKSKNDYSNVASVSKSFISALTGIAVKERLIDSLEQKLPLFFPSYFTSETEASKKEIKIENLLTMTSGLQSIHEASGNWLSIPDIVGYSLSLEMLGFPGTRFDYNSALTHMLSVIITNKSGVTTFDYAKSKLFDKIGITCNKWEKDLFGRYIGGTGMYFTPRDLAKFGNLYVNNGKMNGEDVIPESWVSLSSQPVIKVEASYYYGYGWWVISSQNAKIFFAEGYGGQYIFIFKDYNMVVVATSNPNSSEKANIVTREFFTSKILPAIKK